MSVYKCPNCKTEITCQCEIKTASDGKTCCTACFLRYELGLAGHPVTATPIDVRTLPAPDDQQLTLEQRIRMKLI
jgi:hypothetical protein